MCLGKAVTMNETLAASFNESRRIGDERERTADILSAAVSGRRYFGQSSVLKKALRAFENIPTA